jgi:hypothetical protein
MGCPCFLLIFTSILYTNPNPNSNLYPNSNANPNTNPNRNLNPNRSVTDLVWAPGSAPTLTLTLTLTLVSKEDIADPFGSPQRTTRR